MANEEHEFSRYCVYHRDHRHDTKEFRHLKDFVVKLIKLEKLKEFTRRPWKEIIEIGNELVLVHSIHIEVVIPTIFGGDNESSRRVNLKRLSFQKVNLTTTTRILIALTIPISFFEKDYLAVNNPYNAVIIFMALIVNYQVESILIDIGSLVNIIFKSASD